MPRLPEDLLEVAAAHYADRFAVTRMTEVLAGLSLCYFVKALAKEGEP